MSADRIICAIDPTKECDCASKPFAIDMYKHVIEALQIKYEMSEADAIAEYKNGDKYTRALAVPDEVTKNCKFSPMAKILVEKE